jgi:hypothetical protein
MKKVIVFLCSIILTFSAFAQPKNVVKKIQVIDRSVNPVRQWRIYVFEATKKENIDEQGLINDLSKVKGIQTAQLSNAPADKSRILIYADMNMILAQSPEILQVFKKHNLEITNIPVETN